jgi:hypothetical protein
MTKAFLTPEALKATIQWVKLSPQQRSVLESYIGNGFDKAAALKSAGYSLRTREILAVTTNRVFGNPDMKAALSVFFQEDPVEQFQAELLKVITSKAKVSYPRIAALKLLGKSLGIDATALDAVSEPVVSDKVVEREGKKFRQVITEVRE